MPFGLTRGRAMRSFWSVSSQLSRRQQPQRNGMGSPPNLACTLDRIEAVILAWTRYERPMSIGGESLPMTLSVAGLDTPEVTMGINHALSIHAATFPVHLEHGFFTSRAYDQPLLSSEPMPTKLRWLVLGWNIDFVVL